MICRWVSVAVVVVDTVPLGLVNVETVFVNVVLAGAKTPTVAALCSLSIKADMDIADMDLAASSLDCSNNAWLQGTEQLHRKGRNTVVTRPQSRRRRCWVS
jgi:hypothetical protein